MAATTMTGLRALMKSGDRTRTGRSPACSEPTTGSSRTLSTSPRFGLVLQDTMSLLLQRLKLLFDLPVDVGHVRQTGGDLLAERRPALRVEPALHEIRDDLAALSRRHAHLERRQHGCGQRVGAFCKGHSLPS